MKILIIEDDHDIAKLEQDYLAAEHYECDIAEDGVSGLNMALSHSYDLIILDIMLPGMDGFEVLQRIRKEKETPLILLSARREDFDKIRGLGLGADDYMTKPFSPGELVARVGSHIERYSRLTGFKRSNVLKFRRLEIDRDEHLVRVEGKDCPFTAKEYDLLLFFAENPNRVFSREQLFERIWGSNYGDLATVTVHVRRIREKIEQDPANPQILETVWGAGYRFRA